MSDSATISQAAGQDKTFAILAHIGGLFSSWLAPLIIFLIKKNDPNSSFAAQQAKEALNFQITVFFLYIACFVLSFVLIGLFLFWVVMMWNLVMCIVAAVKSSNGVEYRYPLTLRLVS